MLKESNKVKILSASAVALLALTGTAYGTGALEGDSENESYTDSEIVEQSQDLEVNEAETPEEGEEETPVEDEQETVEGEEETPVEDEQETVEGDSENSEQDLPEEDGEEPEEEEQEETREVNAELEVPFEDLPIDEETGMLDFVAYHEIANGRAMPRPLTEEEQEYYRVYIEEGYYEETRVSVTESEYDFVYVYPRDFYMPEIPALKYHKLVEIRSELLMLEEQEVYLEEQQEIYDMSIDMGQFYDEELGDFVQENTDKEGIGLEDIGLEDDLTEDDLFVPEPVENENPEENKYYEEKEILRELTAYDRMTEEEFKEAYGFNFLFRATLEEGGIYQQEYELEDGLTLVVEAQSMLSEEDGNEDTVYLVWGVVQKVIKYEESRGAYQRGQYNLTTNVNSDGYIAYDEEGKIATQEKIDNLEATPNVIATGGEILREEGKYTPQKVYVTYMNNQVPNMYLLVADAIHIGDTQPNHSDIVGYIEYGLELGDTGTIEDGETIEEDETIEGGGGDRDPRPTDPTEDLEPEGEDPEETDTDREDTSSEGKEEDVGTEEDVVTEEETKEETTSGRFQQTGASIVWGSILTGLGLGALGTYFYKKNNKEDEVDADEE